MNTNQLPSPYELSRIAAALPGIPKKPGAAVKAAMKLWSEALEELSNQQKIQDGKSSGENIAPLPETIDRDITNEPILIASSDGQKSPAMDWINNNPDNKRDRFKSIDRFKAAWFKVHGKDEFCGVWCDVGALRKFLHIRAEQRRVKDSDRKRKKRKTME